MKKVYFIFISILILTSLNSCKKDYACKAIDVTGEELILNCENCSKKDVESYEAEILAKGYVSADCAKK